MDKATIVAKMLDFDEFFITYSDKARLHQVQGTVNWRQDKFILKELKKLGINPDTVVEPDDKAILFWNRTTNSFKCLSIFTIKAVNTLNSVMDSATPIGRTL